MTVEIPRILPEDPERAAHIYRLAVLHKHWLHADSIRERRRLPVRDANNARLPPELLAPGEIHSSFMMVSIWYALLYVVVEGYRAMNLNDIEIDRLLSQADHVERLRRFRNAIFHYQEDPISEKLMAFLLADNSENWIHELNRAFKKFFERELPLAEWLDKVRQRRPGFWEKILTAIKLG